MGGEFSQGALGHVDDGGRGGVGNRRPIDIGRQVAVAVVGGDELQAAGVIAMGERHAEAGRSALR